MSTPELLCWWSLLGVIAIVPLYRLLIVVPGPEGWWPAVLHLLCGPLTAAFFFGAFYATRHLLPYFRRREAALVAEIIRLGMNQQPSSPAVQRLREQIERDRAASAAQQPAASASVASKAAIEAAHKSAHAPQPQTPPQ